MMSENTWLLLSILIFVTALCASALYAIRIRKATTLEPITQFLFFYALFTLPLPIRTYFSKEVEGGVTEHLIELMPYMPFALILCALGLPFFIWAYYSRFARRAATHIRRPKTGASSRTAFVLLAGLSVFLLMLLARSVGGPLNFILLGYGSTEETAEKGHLAMGFPWLFVGSLFLLYRYAVSRKKIDLMLFATVLVPLLGMNLILGVRNQLVYIALTIAIFWHHSIRPIRFKKLAIAGLLIFVALNIVGSVRKSNYENLGDFWTKTATPFNQLDENVQMLYYTLTVGEFVGPFETMPQMIKSVGGEIWPQFGITYMEVPLHWIPRALYPTRPLRLANWYMEKFYGSGFGLNETSQFFFLSEGYLNFGPFGVVATMILWGWLLGAAHNFQQLARGEPGAILLYALTVAFIFQGITGDLASLLVALPKQFLSAAIIGIWISNWRTVRGRVGRRTTLLAPESAG
jgi:oligosaccharide repeat unit polymerase